MSSWVVTFTGARYLLWYGVAGARTGGDQGDAIGFERSPSKSCPPAILPPQFSNTSTIRHVAKFQGSDLSRRICISLPSINQLWLENRSWVTVCWERRECEETWHREDCNATIMKKNQLDKSQLLFFFKFSLNGRRYETDWGGKTDVVLVADVFAEVLTCVSVTTGHELWNWQCQLLA